MTKTTLPSIGVLWCVGLAVCVSAGGIEPVPEIVESTISKSIPLFETATAGSTEHR